VVGVDRTRADATNGDLTADLALALELADIADAITLAHFRSATLRVEHKADDTEVTVADRSSEAAMRARLTAERPDHAVLGEEEGLIGPAGATARWIIDPIDGTSNYVRGIPIWASLIALELDGALMVGVASAPALGRRWWAAKGLGAFADGDRIGVSAVTDLAEAHLAYSDVGSFYDHGRGDALVDLSRRVWRARGLGDFWMHMLVAEGGFDVAVEPVVSLWDLAAVQVIVEEAGGRFTSLDGAPRADGGSACSTNGLLHDEVVRRLTRPTATR
jgi:histidinol-phosphatase